MKTTNITGTTYETVLVNVSKTTFEMSQNAVIYSGGEFNEDNLLIGGGGIVEDVVNKPGINGNVYDIDGTISGLISAIATFGAKTEINIGKHAHISSSFPIGLGGGFSAATISAAGKNSNVHIAQGAEVSGGLGVVIAGSGSSATNSGHISGALYGLAGGDVTGGGAAIDDLRLTNNGLIEEAVGMFATGDDLTLVNGKKGEIVGFAAGLGAFGDATIVNHGMVRVTGQGDTGLLGTAPASILGGLGVQDVTNDGTVIGDVILGDGNDSFDTIGGVLKGKIYGGTGNDTFSIDNNKLKIVELVDEGTDTVRSTVSYTLADNLERLYLLGSKDVNATGNAGDNTLKGNSGDNVLKGLGGADTFYFGTKGGHDTIADLETGVDKINLSNWKGIADFDGVLSHAKNHGDDVWVTLGEDILVIEDHHKGDLVTGDFAF